MGKPNGNAALYALRLRRRMDERAVTVRGLGRLTDPDDAERGRRRVQRHLSGSYMPSAASQRTYAEALDAPELAPDSDEEEESLDARLMRAVRETRSRLAQIERRLTGNRS